jgi:tetratricopeptide (TPR) repeat protein
MYHDKYNDCITKLIAVERLCSTSFTETDVLGVFIKYLLIMCYFRCQDYDRCIRNIEAFTKRAASLYKKRKLKRETGNLLLQIHKVWADVTMMKGKVNLAAKLYQELIELYSIWKSCSYRIPVDYCIDYQEYELSDDQILEAKSNCGEALMNIGETLLAIQKLEDAKKHFLQWLIVSNELVYINILNQLANWYIKINKKNKALENFEASRKCIEATKDDLQISSLILAKVHSNIASIYLDKGLTLEAIKLYQNSLKMKRQKLPEHHEEIEIAYWNLADAYSKANEFVEAYDCYDHAYEISKHVHGKQHKITAKYILNCGRMKIKSEEFEDSIKLYEYASKLYQYIEGGLGKQGKVIYLKLIEIYFKSRDDSKADTHVSELLESLESSKNSEEKYTIFNNLANIQKKYGEHKLSIELYKRALQTVKHVHRNNYMYLKQTCRILINLAEVYVDMENYQNSVKYYEHALNVMNNTSPMANPESAKLQIKLANSQIKWNLKSEALRNYEQSLDILDNIPTRSDLKLEATRRNAKKELKILRTYFLI